MKMLRHCSHEQVLCTGLEEYILMVTLIHTC